MTMTLEEIDADLTALRLAKRERLTAGTRSKISYSNGSVEKSLASLEDINGEIARLEVLRARLTGGPSGGGPIRIGFGGRT